MEKKVGLIDIIQAGHGERYQVFKYCTRKCQQVFLFSHYAAIIGIILVVYVICTTFCLINLNGFTFLGDLCTLVPFGLLFGDKHGILEADLLICFGANLGMRAPGFIETKM